VLLFVLLSTTVSFVLVIVQSTALLVIKLMILRLLAKLVLLFSFCYPLISKQGNSASYSYQHPLFINHIHISICQL